MAKSLFIHIGAHKTGTTAAQSVFDANRAALADRGFLYPQSCLHQFAQHRLAFALKGPDRRLGPDASFESEMAELSAEVAASDCPVVILSSEAFFSLPPAAVQRFAEAVQGFETRIIAVLRRPDTLFESIFNQKVKVPQSAFHQPHTHFLADPLSLDRDMHFDRTLANWSTAFGHDAIILRRYEERPDMFGLLAETMGIDPTGLAAEAARKNKSPPAPVIELIRQAKEARLGYAAVDQLRRFGLRLFAEAPVPGGLLTPQERLDILKAADAMTDTVFSTYGSGANPYASHLFKLEDFTAQARLDPNMAQELMAEFL